MPEPTAGGRPFVDPGGLLAFWEKYYLAGYLPGGGCTVKWLAGREGSGKTTLLTHLRSRAATLGYLHAHIDAGEVPLGRFDEVYRSVAPLIPVQDLALIVARAVARHVGADRFDPRADGPLETWLVGQGRAQPAVESELRPAFDFLYAQNNIAPPVATVLQRVTEPLIHARSGRPEARDIAGRWLRGERVVAAERRLAGIGMTVDRHGARDVLRSILFAVQCCGEPGLVLTVDRMQALVGAPGKIHYTRMRREDAYEGIRELIDEGARLPGLMIVFAGRPEVFQDTRAGLVSFPALAMRVANEVQASRSNLFNDLVDLDQLWREDWPRYREALVRAYEAPPDVDLDPGIVFAGPISPVKRLVEAIGERGRLNDAG